MASTITPSTSPLCYFYTSPISRFAFTFKIRASSSSPTTMAAASAAKVVPAVIVGGGRVGRALQEMGNRDDVLVRRAEPVPLDFAGPILVCTRNDDLEAVLQSTPQSRWSCTISSHLIDYTANS